MRILLFVFNIYNTIDNLTSEELNELNELIIKIADNDLDQKIIISICDDTDNKEVSVNFLRKFLIDKVSSGYILLNDIYYREINGGAHTYRADMSKEEKIVEYANSLEEQDNFVNLYYISGNEVDFYKFHSLNQNVSCKVVNESNGSIISVLNKPNYCIKYKRD